MEDLITITEQNANVINFDHGNVKIKLIEIRRTWRRKVVGGIERLIVHP